MLSDDRIEREMKEYFLSHRYIRQEHELFHHRIGVESGVEGDVGRVVSLFIKFEFHLGGCQGQGSILVPFSLKVARVFKQILKALF